MKLSDCILLAVKCIASKKFRTLLNILGIVIGVSSIIAIMCVGQGGVTAVAGKLNKMGMNAIAIKTAANSSDSIKLNDYKYLNKVLKDVSITPVYMNYATLDKDGTTRDVIVWGVSEGFQDIYNISLASGRYFNTIDVEKSKKSAIVEGTITQKFFGNSNSNQNLNMNFKGKRMEINITGVVDDSDESFKNNFGDSVPVFVYMPITTVMKFFNSQSLDYISIKPQDSASMDNLGLKSVRLLERKTGRTGKYYAENLTSQRKTLESIIDLITLILSAVAAISLVVGSLGIMNIMLVSVTERTGEIGMMKAIGAKNKDILVQFLIEATIITVIGAFIGCIAGMGIGYLITYLAGLPFEFKFQNIITVMLVVTVIGMIFGVYPAKLASRLDPVNALR